MRTRGLVGVLVCGVFVIATGCWPNRISVSPDGLIALTMSEETVGLYEAFPSSGSIWLVAWKTGQVQEVLTDKENLLWGIFSPDGQEVLYLARPRVASSSSTWTFEHPWRLVIYDRRTKAHTELMTGEHGLVRWPAFSPNGRKIAYYREDRDSLGLYLLDRNAQEEKFLKLMSDRSGTYYVPYEPGPLWTPDEKGIFVFRVEEFLPQGRAFSGRLEILDIECGCEQSVVQGVFVLANVPLFLIASKDGEKLYVNGYDDEDGVNLYEITVETGEKIVLYDGRGLAFSPALSPDGEQLLITVVADGDQEQVDLYAINVESRELNRLTDDGRSSFGFWLSESAVGFLRSAEILVKDLSTGQERNLSPLVAVQHNVIKLNLQLAKLIEEKQAYQDELLSTRQALQHLTEQLAGLTNAVIDLSAQLDTVQTQSRELGDQTSQQLNSLEAKISVLGTQAAGLEEGVRAARERPTLALWQLVIALIFTAVVIIVALRRALHHLAQQLAFPPQ